MLRLVLALGVLLAASGCASTHGDSSAGGGAGQAGAPSTDATVELGLPGGADGLDFIPLADGAVLKLQTFGQGGTHVVVGVRCTGFGSRAFVSARLHNELTDVEVIEPAPARPQLLYCDDQGVCDLVPYLVHASGIAAPDAERDGLPVRLTAKVSAANGVTAEGSVEAVLSTADL